MKKEILMLVSLGILCACVTMTPEQKREIFETKIPKPTIDCMINNIGERPTKVSVSMDDIEVYDTSMCATSKGTDGETYYVWTGMRPVQQINSREFLAYPCYSNMCQNMLYHFKFPYSVEQLQFHSTNSFYNLYNFYDICVARGKLAQYSYTTSGGFKNTVYSVKLVKKREYSIAERKKLLNELKAKKLKEAQEEWNKKYQQQEKEREECKNISVKILEAWENNNDVSTYCNEINHLRNGYYSPSNQYYLKTCSHNF